MRTEIIKTYLIWDNKDKYVGYTTDFNTYNYFRTLLKYESNIIKIIKYIYITTNSENKINKIEEYLKNIAEKFNTQRIIINVLYSLRMNRIIISMYEYDKNNLKTDIDFEWDIDLMGEK